MMRTEAKVQSEAREYLIIELSMTDVPEGVMNENQRKYHPDLPPADLS